MHKHDVMFYVLCTGDVESLLQLDKFCQTAVCTRETEYYELSLLQWTKLLQLKQNNKYTEMMMKRLQLRMTSRLSRPTVKHVPLYGLLLKLLSQQIQQADDLARQV